MIWSMILVSLLASTPLVLVFIMVKETQ